MDVINEKRENAMENRFVRPKNVIKKCWIPRGMMFEVNEKEKKVSIEGMLITVEGMHLIVGGI